MNELTTISAKMKSKSSHSFELRGRHAFPVACLASFLLPACILAILATEARALDAVPTLQSPAPSAEKSKLEGLSDSDWSSIRDAYDASQHTFQALDDGTHIARSPGQAWTTVFDGRGFIVRPDHGEWTWGMDLVSVGDQVIGDSPAQVGVDGSGQKLSYHWSEQIEEWFINDQRGWSKGGRF